ncbi:MAG: phosphopentomutase [Clostridia bacterium]|nr:phosphopentomutase [Clostridia bacterium]
MTRVILLVLDSVGVGALPDAAKYGDENSNTLANIAKAVGGLSLPALESLGLGKIIPIQGISSTITAKANYGKMNERSPGKDTTTGHWEMVGIILDKPFPTYPSGFPRDVIREFEEKIGRGTIGNKAVSGTAIIEELGAEHVAAGMPIVYTSADSVFQIAAHEEIIPLDDLYRYCLIARELLRGEHAVGRVIARPFTGQPGSFIRTPNRKDFSLTPTGETVLQKVVHGGFEVVAIGKVGDIFAHEGITRSITAKNNQQNIEKLLVLLQEEFQGLIFTNLVDFDMLFGHRNDPAGYAEELVKFDKRLPEIINSLQANDLLIITADHGTDPTNASTDHSREYVPVLIYHRGIKGDHNLGIRETFADVAQTICTYLQIEPMKHGTSMLTEGE